MTWALTPLTVDEHLAQSDSSLPGTTGAWPAIIVIGCLVSLVLLSLAAVMVVVTYRRAEHLRRLDALVDGARILAEANGLPLATRGPRVDPRTDARRRSSYQTARARLEHELTDLNTRLSNHKAASGGLGPDDDPNPLGLKDWD